ncbi:FMN-binding negative transcriptional regulator [Streptomyces sp. NPDC015125]|uniref:FMN-binding negative transcriptional regulator n=1 Tax=Streptomyces sp. NPDC015125 TaxID=3364938 RepID=UPI0036FC771C
MRRIPTVYYSSVQLCCTAEVIDSPQVELDVLRNRIRRIEPDSELADPSVRSHRLREIRALRLTISEVTGECKFGGNVDEAPHGSSHPAAGPE